MATPWNGFDLPVVGADADVWGGKINTILTAIDVLLSSPANTLKGNNTGSQASTSNLTPTQVTAMLDAVGGSTQGVGGTKGLAPTPAAGSQNYPLVGGGTFKRGVGRAFGCVITTTSVNGSQPTIAGAMNVASISPITTVGSAAYATITFTDSLPDTNFSAHVQPKDFSVPGGYDNKATTSLRVFWNGNPGEISVSGF